MYVPSGSNDSEAHHATVRTSAFMACNQLERGS